VKYRLFLLITALSLLPLGTANTWASVSDQRCVLFYMFQLINSSHPFVPAAPNAKILESMAEVDEALFKTKNFGGKPNEDPKKLRDQLSQAQRKYSDALNEEAESSGKYRTVPMAKRHQGENSIGLGDEHFIYERIYNFSQKEMDGFKVYFVGGELFTKNRRGKLKPLSCSKCNFVMNRDGDIFVNSKGHIVRGTPVYHNSLSGGHPVSGAGVISVKDGKIEKFYDLTPQSGHYAELASDEERAHLRRQVLEELHSNDVDIMDPFDARVNGR